MHFEQIECMRVTGINAVYYMWIVGGCDSRGCEKLRVAGIFQMLGSLVGDDGLVSFGV